VDIYTAELPMVPSCDTVPSAAYVLMEAVNPAVGVLAPTPGRLSAGRLRRAETADRIRFFLAGRLAAHRPTVDLVLPLALLSFISTVATLAAPVLRANPLLLMTLSPRLPFLALAATRVGLIPFVLIGTARLCLADPFHFRIGRRLASPGGGGSSGGRLGARIVGHRLARPASAAAVVLRPNGRHLALAGAVGLRAPLVVVLDLAGTVLYLGGLHEAAALFA
jgi:hypothetical protein